MEGLEALDTASALVVGRIARHEAKKDHQKLHARKCLVRLLLVTSAHMLGVAEAPGSEALNAASALVVGRVARQENKKDGQKLHARKSLVRLLLAT